MQGLGEKWAPGFEPGNMKEGNGAAFKQILDYLREEGVSTLSTWEVHESNVGPQPQWLFDSVNSFLDGPDALKSDDAAGSEWRPRRVCRPRRASWRVWWPRWTSKESSSLAGEQCKLARWLPRSLARLIDQSIDQSIDFDGSIVIFF